MEILFAIAIIWLIVTLLGHGSWILTSRIFRSLFGGNDKHPTGLTARQGFNLVVDKLHNQGLLDREQAAELWNNAAQLDQPLPPPPPPQTATLVSEPVADPMSVFAEPLQPDAEAKDADPLVATVSTSRRSLAAMIESFLAVHNIRWGELIAGMLIVVCSIGLVVSLWNTLVSAHRIVPTLVFLVANAAIFAAGFYTLAKWRLRHTSRAVLMIASLLVPLTVLAGLATANQAGDSVSLSSPLTLAVIVLGMVVNVWLLLRAGRALYGAAKSPAFALAVAAPTLLMPFVPPTLRLVGAHAGYLAAPAALAVALAIVWFQRPWQRKRETRRYLTAVSRHQWTFMAVATFSLMALAAGISMLGRSFKADLWLPVVTTCLPALIAVGVASHWTSLRTRFPTHRFIGKTVSVLVGGVLCVLLPLFSDEPKWLWLYGVVGSLSCLLLWSAYRRAPWLAIAGVPVGIATVLSSTTTLQRIDWNSISWTRRVFGGEPMLACLALGAISVGLLLTLRKSEHKHSISLLSALWFAWASLTAAVLAFAPESWRGVVPEWALVGVLAVLTLVNAIAAIFTRLPTAISVVLACIVSHSLFRPFTLSLGGIGQIGDEIVWFKWCACAAGIMTLLSLLADRLTSARATSLLRLPDSTSLKPAVNRSLSEWLLAIAVLAGLSLAAIVNGIWNQTWLTHPPAAIAGSVCFLTISAVWFVLSRNADAARRTTLAAALLAPASTLWTLGYFDIGLVTWLQLTAIATLVWAELPRLVEPTLSRDTQSPAARSFAEQARPAFVVSVIVALTIGFLSAFASVIAPIIHSSRFSQHLDWVYLLVSVAAIAYALIHGIPVQRSTNGKRLHLGIPLAVSLMSGQCVWLSEKFLPQSTFNPVIVLFSILTLAAVCSLVRFSRLSRAIDLWHVAALSVLGLFADQLSSSLPAHFVLVLLTITGIAATMRWFDPESKPLTAWSLRLLIWFAVVGQAWTLARVHISTGQFEPVWTFLIVCNSIWIVYGELRLRRDTGQSSHQRLPELMLLTLLMVALEVLLRVDALPTADTPLLAVRLGLLWLCVIAVWLRSYTWQQLFVPISAAVALTAVLAFSIGKVATLERSTMFVSSVLTAAFVSALLAFYFPVVAQVQRFVATKLGNQPSGTIGAHGIAVLSPLALSAILAAITAVGLMASDKSTSLVIVTIAGVAMSAIGISEISERLNKTSLQRAAIAFGLLAIYLWASIPATEQPYPVLCGTMRWLVASVWLIPILLWGIPRTFGSVWATRWRGTMRLAAGFTAAVGLGSLIAMLLEEMTLRTSSGIAGLPMALVIGVAVTIGLLSLLVAVLALASGPSLNLGPRWANATAILHLEPVHRRALIVAAQILGGVTWLHVFLCNPEFGLVGLRAHWPYLVLGLSFLSVGLVEWTRRRRDDVIAGTLQQTSLYLPLISVVGILLSGTWSKPMLSAMSAFSSLSFLLMLATGYYLLLSKLWSGWLPRVLMVVIANSTVWSVLAAQPGWGLLSHPQLWLIPPAACVLLLAQRYRDQLDSKLAAAIRYGATLTIYISSTADMLIQQIGTTLWGPIILILLALAGIAAGALLQIRPFLYLGSLFVLIALLSMVWHAARSIDQVWPWWAFGITMGIGLLAGLMSIEKNKGKLKALSARLSAWD